MEREARYPDYIGISDVNTKSFEQMRVEGYFDGQPSIMFDEPEGFDIGDPPDLHLQPKYEQINFDLYVKTREKTERVQDLARETDRRCPQIGLFRMAGVPMIMSWYREGSKRPLFVDRFHIGRGKTPEEKLIEKQKSRLQNSDRLGAAQEHPS